MAGARARNGLRSSASGIAFADRFAVCLLLAGFLSVGPATAKVALTDGTGGDVGHFGATVTVRSRIPVPDSPIGARKVVADGKAITFDLEDLNGNEEGAPKAFSDPANGELTYTLVPKREIATITVDGSVVTITPIWRDDTDTTRVRVTATNTRDETSVPVYFDLTVETARKPIVNADPVIQGILTSGFSLRTGADPLVIHLRNLTGAEDAEDHVPLFIDPNVAEGDLLPGGLLFGMSVEDVVADHVYASLSEENDVYTSGHASRAGPCRGYADRYAHRSQLGDRDGLGNGP